MNRIKLDTRTVQRHGWAGYNKEIEAFFYFGYEDQTIGRVRNNNRAREIKDYFHVIMNDLYAKTENNKFNIVVGPRELVET